MIGVAPLSVAKAPLLYNCFKRLHQAVILAALRFDPARQLGADALDGPAVKILVEEARRSFQLRGGQIVIEHQHTIQHRAGLGNHHGQHTARDNPRKMDVLQRVELLGAGQGDAESAGNQRQDVRGALQVLLAGADSGKALLDLLHALGSENRNLGSAEMLDVKAESPSRGNAPRGGMRLIQEAGLSKRGHDIADGRRAHPVLVAKMTGEGLRRHRFPGSNVGLDDGRQDGSFARTQSQFRTHAEPPAIPGKR